MTIPWAWVGPVLFALYAWCVYISQPLDLPPPVVEMTFCSQADIADGHCDFGKTP